MLRHTLLACVLLAQSSIAAPIARIPAGAANFPMKSAAQFFQGAQRVIDLGSGVLWPDSNWTLELARSRPSVEVHTVDNSWFYTHSRPTDPPPNLHRHVYDYLDPPQDRPQGDRVVLNSPAFEGTMKFQERMKRLVASIDAHLLPGGLFYSVFDMNLVSEDDFPHSSVLADRVSALHVRLRERFGQENVVATPLAGYSKFGQLNAMPCDGYFDVQYLQIRKPD